MIPEGLQVRDLCTYFFGRTSVNKAVDGISYEVRTGEIMAIVGESGCGKTVSALSLLQLNPPGSRIIRGQVLWEGRDLLRMGADEISRIRGKEISMVFQEPLTALNPIMTIGQQIAEVFQTHEGLDKKEAERKTIEMLEGVAMPDPEKRAKSYPFQLSGGMRQRAMIAMALGCRPALLIADEPTTAVDVTIQAQLLELITSVAKEIKTTVILITHNLGIVARYASKIVIMYAGKFVEKGETAELYAHPRHPYTISLLKAVPRLDQESKQKLVTIDGQPPPLDHRLPPGCSFHPRCIHAREKCKEEIPAFRRISDNHEVACWFVEG
ncbi:MAG: ABC transporter ATP-binding protein [Proteobacteria bacterium]|nr:ABC transporter ATP-binding protein [Pseudomonadota bacterium]